MEQTFGWRVGFYETFFRQTVRLAPNIAVFCKTPVAMKDGTIQTINMINSIGYAFDSKDQIDYKLLRKMGRQTPIEKYVKVFDKIFVCAEEYGLQTIVMSLVGAGVFALYWEGLLEDIWIPAFNESRRKFRQFTILFMGPTVFPVRSEQVGFKVVNLGFFPQNVEKVDVKQTLFVNAWDCFSMAGNGNAKDESLDGHVGRNTAVALLCWPLTNKYLQDPSKYKKI